MVGLRRGAADRCGGDWFGSGARSCGRGGCGDGVGGGRGCVGARVGVGDGVGGGGGGWGGGGRASAACSSSQPGVWQGLPHATPNCPGHRGQHGPCCHRDRRRHPGVTQVPVSVSIGTTGVCCGAAALSMSGKACCFSSGSSSAGVERRRLALAADAGERRLSVAVASWPTSAGGAGASGSPCAPSSSLSWGGFSMLVGKPSESSAAGPSASGGAPDLRATLRASLRRSGEIGRLLRTTPRQRPPDLVALCDISGSMSAYSRMMMIFLHALAVAPGASWGGVSAFTFGRTT